MRASQATMLLSIAAALAWCGPSEIFAQAAGGYVSAELSVDASSSQLSCDDEEPYAGPLSNFIEGIGDRLRNCPDWTFSAEGIALQRSTTRSQSLFQSSGTTVSDVLNSKTMDFPVEYGPQLSVMRQIGCSDFSVEVAYFQVDGFAANSSVPGDSLMVVDQTSTRLAVTDASAAYTSALYVGDINLRWQWRERIALISGFRMGQLNEHYRANGTATGGGDAYALNTDAFNHLYGFQLGADATVLDFGGPLKLKGICRAGAFANYASQRDSLTESEMQTEVNASRNNHMAFLGEAGAVLTYAITKNLSFRASYEAMWLEGVALAPEQISSSNLLLGTASVNANGSVFYHGGGLGVEYRY
ncbi:MAG: hypothetical protein ABFC63_11190 [Thermoguttaceae bacterium]